MKKSFLLHFTLFLFFLHTAWAQVAVTGELKQWHKVTLTLESGIATSEIAATNPFTDYRLNVTFTKGTKTYLVPGYYAGDGNAANTGATAGSKWRVHFCPDETGVWNYTVSFRTGSYVAVSAVATAGTAVAPLNGLSGSFTIQSSNKTGTDYRAKGKLRYVGKHHLQFAGTGEYFVKGGSYCPENFLAYHEFDGTYDVGGAATTLPNGLHQYTDHLQDWHNGDPTWQNGKGKAILGSLNYIAAQGMNAFGFIVMNVKGDGDDVWPWLSHNVADRERFDVSKLDQWEIVFTHMDSLGIALHIVLSERENQMLLDNGELGNQRRLFYRELIARYSHHLAILWDLGEENGREFLSRGVQSDQQRKDMATYFKTYDPYKSFVCLNAYDNTAIYRPLLGYPDYDGTSQQDYAQGVHNFTVQWRDSSAIHGRKWVIFHDETRGGITIDGAATNHQSLRKSVLWGNLMGGGGGVAWYFGADDLSVETFRTRANVWNFTRHALTFFNSYLPFGEMKNQDALTSSTSDYCYALPGKVYAVYVPNNSSTNINLPCGNYSVKWFDPKNGGALLNGSVTTVNSGNVNLGVPPYTNEDWVVLVRNTFSVSFDIVNTGGCANPQAQVRANPIGGTSPFTFLWSTGATAQTANGLTPGTYSITVTGSNGCSASEQVTIPNTSSGSVTAVTVSICSGGQYFAGGAFRTQPGTYYDTLNGAGNCDSIIITTLNVRSPIRAYRTIFICSGESYFAGGTLQTQSGTYFDNYKTAGNCDSILATVLNVRTPIVTNLAVSICNGQNHFAGGNYQTLAGTYYDMLSSSAGCDSTIITQLSVVNAFVHQTELEICEGESILLGGSLRTTSGVYRDTLTSASGCDSVLVTTLAVTYCNPCTVFDCNNVCDGTALIDQCDRCVGGNTGLTACTDCNLRINSLSLMYEGRFGEVAILKNGLVISKDTLCRFNVRANVCRKPIGSVRFILNGNTFRIESQAPYSLYGDSPVGYYTPWMPAAGTYTLTAIPYSGSGASGTAGTAVTINFTVINPSGGTPLACTTPPKVDCNGKVNGTALIDGCGICSGGNTGHVANSNKDNCGVCFGNNSTCCQTVADCNDFNACTIDACQSGNCLHTPMNCNDNDGCTIDFCTSGICQHAPHDCNDNIICTLDFCSANQCQHTQVPGQSCCITNVDCNDNNACTTDLCTSGQCSHQAITNESAYLKVVNPARSWRKLKLGYSPTNIWSPKLDVTASGNHTVCITLRDPLANAEWSKIQMRPQASSANAVALGSYLPQGGVGNAWTTICIPLSAFNGFNFTQISYFEFPFSNGANMFEIHVRKIEFIGGTTPFLWFGGAKTDNYHDGQSGSSSALIAQVVPGQACGSAKQDEQDANPLSQSESDISFHAYPNPFNEELNIEFTLTKTSNAKLEIYNLTGQLLGVLYEGEVKANEFQKFTFNSASLPNGMLIYRLQTDDAAYYGKAMLVR
mgnify:CR=1 FL=1